MKTTHGGIWRKGLLALALCATAVCAAAWRAPVAPAQVTPTGVAIVNLKTLFDGLTEYKEGLALIEEKKKEVEASLKQIENDLKKLTADFEALKDPPMAVRLEWQVKIVEKQAQGEARLVALRRSLEVQAGDIMRRMFDKAVSTGERLAAKDGWDIILIDDRSVTPPEKIVESEGSKDGRRITAAEVKSIIQQRTIFVANDKRVDVTPALIAMMNNEYKGGRK